MKLGNDYGYPTIEINMEGNSWFPQYTIQDLTYLQNMIVELYGEDVTCTPDGFEYSSVIYIKYNPEISYHWLAEKCPNFVFRLVPTCTDNHWGFQGQSKERTNTLNAKFCNYMLNIHPVPWSVDDSEKPQYTTKFEYLNDLHDFMGQHLYNKEDLKMKTEEQYERERDYDLEIIL